MIRPLEEIAWLNGEGELQEVVISSRIRLARNLADAPFPPLGHLESLGQVESRLAQILATFPDLEYANVAGFDEMQMALLAERHLISPPFCGHHCPRGLALDSSCRLAVMVNESRHVPRMNPGGGNGSNADAGCCRSW